MVIEWIYGLLSSLLGGFLGLFPDLPSLTSLAGKVSGGMSTVASYASAFSSWVPFGQVGAGISTIMAAVLAAFIIKAIRIILSLVTVGGGSAG